MDLFDYMREQNMEKKCFNEPEMEVVHFNVKDIFSQDVACYLDKHNICIRSVICNDSGIVF